MSNHNPLLWNETSPGCYERELDEAEQFYATMGKIWEGTGHTYFAITACVGFTVEYPIGASVEVFERGIIEAFLFAWKRLRFEHPTLAASTYFDPITRKSKKLYKSLDLKSDLEDWGEETFNVMSEVNSGPEFANSDPVVGEYASLYILTPQSVDDQRKKGIMARDIVFRSGHDIIDGIGTLKLFNSLFNHAVKALGSHWRSDFSTAFGAEHKHLSPPLQIAARIPENPTEDQKADFQRIRAANADARENVEVLGVPISLTTTMPGASKRVAIHLSSAETENIVLACKLFGVTPTHLFHASIALALRDIQLQGDKERKARYISYALINLRGVCKDNLDKLDIHPVSVRQTVSVKHLIVDLTVPAESFESSKASKGELLGVLNHVRGFYRGNILDDDFLSTVPLLYKTVTPPYPDFEPEVPEPNPSPPVSLSSLGVIDKLIQPQHGPLKLKDPWVMGAEYSTGLGLFLGSWNGEISLSAGYNEAFHSEAAVHKFLKTVRSVVFDIVDVMK